MSLPSYLKTQGDVVYLHVKAQPRASRNEIGEAMGNELKIKITAPPVDSEMISIKVLAPTFISAKGAPLMLPERSSTRTISVGFSTISGAAVRARVILKVSPQHIAEAFQMPEGRCDIGRLHRVSAQEMDAVEMLCETQKILKRRDDHINQRSPLLLSPA